ncbi:DUF3592 domain-containing protein [Nocardia sp. NPDC052566]|uniref:DUF3592 domain-containing protein n=1 Tax=Nocardia sp. NPDC052566 TaxID=3364330 RepID=UPI0037C885A4
MEIFFYIVPSLIDVVIVLMAYRAIRQALQLRKAWASGVTAKGRCVHTFTTTSGGGGDSSVSTTLHHVYEFTAGDGQVVRFEETGGPATRIEGDDVTVYYAEGHEKNATASAPKPVATVVGTVFVLLFLTVILAGSVAFMVLVAKSP